MPFVSTVPPARATPELKKAYRYVYRVAGVWIPGNIFRVFSQRPSTMARYVRDWEVAMWACQEPRRNRELVAVAASRLARCEY